MRLYRTIKGNILENNNSFYQIEGTWDQLINCHGLHSSLLQLASTATKVTADAVSSGVLAPIVNQEVWASGVTYLRSRDARMEESKSAGGGDFYSRVYEADRPEIFFKALAHRVSATGEPVYIRKDSTWNVPEPELTLFINSLGEIEAYTVGNDMSSRSIEGENPLYLPQAKSYERSTALGPCLYVPEKPIDPATTIRIDIQRGKEKVFEGAIQLNRMKRTLPELAGWLFKELKFPHGCFLMTGTGLVPGNEFTLAAGDVVNISIENIGTLTNTVEVSGGPELFHRGKAS